MMKCKVNFFVDDEEKVSAHTNATFDRNSNENDTIIQKWQLILIILQLALVNNTIFNGHYSFSTTKSN